MQPGPPGANRSSRVRGHGRRSKHRPAARSERSPSRTASSAAATDTAEGLDPVADLAARTERIRRDMGGAAKVAKIHDAGDRTIRDHIAGLLDPGSFREVGTFSRSLRPEDRDSTPGDGKIGGEGTIGGGSRWQCSATT